MESLALLVTGLLLGMLVSSLTAFIMGWRARKRGTRIAAVVVGIPGALLGALFFSSANTMAGAIIGLLGVTGLVAAAYWLWRSPRELVQD